MENLIISTLGQGLLWSLLAIGVFITFRVLDIADLTVEGSFPLGAAISVTLIVAGVNPLLSILVAAIGGAIAGIITGLVHTKLKIPALLAGILTMIALYSINLHVMGKANVSLLRMDTVYTYLGVLNLRSTWALTIVGLLGAILACVFLFWFFGTEIGAAIRATGINQQMIRAQGVNTDTMILIGLALSNAFVATAGAFVAQGNGYADVGMGVGTIVIGLASVIIGEVLFGTRSFVQNLLAVVLGSVVYRIVIAVVLYLGMPPNDLKLFTAILVAIALALPTLKAKWQSR